MNTYQSNLYRDLMDACSKTDAFYFVDHTHAGVDYRVFTYRLASYTDFMLPNAMECRGHTFYMSAGHPVALACLPMEKAFNLNENPYVMGIDLNTIEQITDKLDGSLISTVQTPYGMEVKSKTSFASEQAENARKYLKRNEIFLRGLKALSGLGYTVNMEYTSPENRIVIGYQSERLTVLNVRNRADGSYMKRDEILKYISPEYLVDELPVPENGEEFVQSIYDMEGIEGYIIRFSCGKTVKVKCDAYCVLHKTKDSVTVPRRLFEACVEGQSDDLRAMFASDESAIKLINDMEDKVSKLYNGLSKRLDAFYNENKHLERKEYAIKGQAELSEDGTFGLAMALYTGKKVDLESFLIKNYRKYGIKDDAVITEDE